MRVVLMVCSEAVPCLWRWALALPYESPRRRMTRRLRRGLRLTILWVSRPLRCPKISKVRAESPLVRLWAHTPCLGWSMTRRLRRGWSGCRPEGAVLSFEAKESTKESPRHGDSRGGGPPRCALFANIGVPGTAVPAPLRVIRKYRRSGHCRARLLYLLRPASR